MDLPSYYRHQAYSACQLAGAYHEQRQTKAALERVAQEYEGIAQDLEKWCGRDPASRYDLVTYIDAYRARCAVAAFDAAPVDQPIRVCREARANIEQGQRIDSETRRQTSRQVEDEVTP
jgi:hypothetical protein